MSTRRQRVSLAIIAAPVTEKGLRSVIPMFVEDDSPDDHKCGNCALLILGRSGDQADCTLVEGGVSRSRGTCSFWTKGEPSSPDQIKPTRLDHHISGYVEVKNPSLKVQCGTCFAYTDGYCEVWEGEVKLGQCCGTWDNPECLQ